MINLKKTWVRILVSFIAGGFISETAFILGGDLKRPRGTDFTLLYAVLVYLFITAVFYFTGRKQSKNQ